jgi:hypothetical protein
MATAMDVQVLSVNTFWYRKDRELAHRNLQNQDNENLAGRSYVRLIQRDSQPLDVSPVPIP